MTIITRQDQAGIAVLTWDQPGSPVNAANRDAVAELIAAMDAAITDASVTGIVLASAKKGFVAGGDLRELQAVTAPDEARGLVSGVLALNRRMEQAGKPIIAAINGPTMGGGFELALACHARVADSSAMIGLPEVGLGLMPGGGGTQRLPRLIGIEAALPMMTDGKPIPAARALELGIVSRVVERADLLDAAIALAQSTDPVQPWDKTGGAGTLDEAALTALAGARKKAARRSGAFDVAETRIIETVEQGFVLPFDQAMALETETFANLVVTPAAKNRIRTMFFALNDAKAIRSRPKDEPPYALKSIAVVGGGLMGGGIAFTAAQAGLNVVLIEVTQEALDRGMAAINATGDRQVKAGRMDQQKRDAILARIRPQTSYEALGDVDAAIEAVVEIEKIKADVLGKLSAAMRPGAPIGSNTSTLPITQLAGFCARPEDFLGTHFFGPVERMPLVEVIRGKATADATLARMLDLMKLMRKTPVVVNDGLGFYTSRVVAAYTGEALTMLAEGVPPQLIDRAAMEFGMVIGPCTMADMTGLPLLIDILTSAYSDAGRTGIQGNRSLECLKKFVEAGRKGRRDGAGIYDYDENGRARPWDGFAGLFPAEGDTPSPEVVTQRLMHAQALETARALEEGIVASPTDADVASVLGWMFPKGAGGVLSYVDTLGAARFVAECDALKTAHGPRFDAPAALRKLAETGGRYHAI